MIRVLWLALAVLIGPAGSADAGSTLADRAERVIDRLVAEHGVRRIAVLHRMGAPGRAGRDAVTAALRARGLGLVAVASHRGGVAALRRALGRIHPAAPEALVIIGRLDADARGALARASQADLAHLPAP